MPETYNLNQSPAENTPEESEQIAALSQSIYDSLMEVDHKIGVQALRNAMGIALASIVEAKSHARPVAAILGCEIGDLAHNMWDEIQELKRQQGLAGDETAPEPEEAPDARD